MMPRFRIALCAGAVLATSACVSPVLGDVINADFETMTNTVGSLPTDYGYWRGDGSDITGAANGINPFEGQRMLRFRHTTANGPAGSVGSEIWQIIDVSDSIGTIRSGNASVNISAWFNRIAQSQNNDVDTAFSVSVSAYAGSVGSFPNQWNQSELAASSSFLNSDNNINSWEMSSVSLNLPELTDFIVVRLSATEDMFNDISGDEFYGHFVDGLTYNLVPAPAALAGLLPVAFMARRRRRA